jgi:hypothetical protein
VGTIAVVIFIYFFSNPLGFQPQLTRYSPLINQCGTANARVQRQHQELANVYKQLGLSSLEGWYGVSSTKIRANGGTTVLRLVPVRLTYALTRYKINGLVWRVSFANAYNSASASPVAPVEVR